MIRIALYTEDSKLLPLLSTALGSDFEISLEASAEGLDAILAEGASDVAILDLDSGATALEERIAHFQNVVTSRVPSIVMADDGLRQAAAELVRLGAFSYCRRPPSIRDLKVMLHRACESGLLKQKLHSVELRSESRDSFFGMIGASSGIRQVGELVRRVAGIPAPVLVTGESGAGKELVASAIHKLGSHSQRPFVAVSCGAIPETLIEAELFGHEKGAFTSAAGARTGYFEQAADGILFLDEIGELTPATQVKLLRVLQEREFSRLGSNRLIPLRARIIFATHEDLPEMVAQGKFRQDLFYRIHVMTIHVPSLRDRHEDIPALARHFLGKYAQAYGKNVHSIEADAMAMLEAYPWPGNVRELENVIQRAMIVANGESIQPQDLPEALHDETIVDISEYRTGSSFERQLREYKVRLAISAVRDNHGNKTLAARQLQISRAYLHRLIRIAEMGPAAVQHSGAMEIA